ncbi:MAG: chloride channel protein [Acidiferrobacterales bacterium]|nr:chloride channel protein [Acidiferrobacterales bacterium]
MLIRLTIVTLLGIVVGIVVAFLAISFVELVLWLNDILLVSPRSRMLFGNGYLLSFLTVLIPTVAGVITALILQKIPEKRPHNVPDAILASQSLSKKMPLKTGVLSSTAAIISLGSGASVGQYGPLAYMGSFIGSWISRLFGGNYYLGTIGIGCGAAAAISTAFNAPIAGLIFAHEVILRHYSLRSFAPITVAATIGYLIANHVMARPPLFRIEHFQLETPYEFFGFILIGVAGAFVATLLIKGILFSAATNKKVMLPAPIKTGLAGMLVGIFALQIPEILGIGKELLRFSIIEDAFTNYELASILFAKIFLTAICLGFGFAGGVFSPALLIGVLFGALVAGSLDTLAWYERSHIVIYAICGMVAVAGPVIGAPLTTILIVFELTRNYDIATAAMVSVAFANLISYRVVGRSLFDIQLVIRGFDLSLGRDKVIVEQRKVEDYVSTNFLSLPKDLSVSEAQQQMLEVEKSEAYIVGENDIYFGKLSIRQTLILMSDQDQSEVRIQDLAMQKALQLAPEESIWDAMIKMEAFVGESIPVVENGYLKGVVFEATIVSAYLNTIHNIREEENAAG